MVCGMNVSRKFINHSILVYTLVKTPLKLISSNRCLRICGAFSILISKFRFYFFNSIFLILDTIKLNEHVLGLNFDFELLKRTFYKLLLL